MPAKNIIKITTTALNVSNLGKGCFLIATAGYGLGNSGNVSHHARMKFKSYMNEPFTPTLKPPVGHVLQLPVQQIVMLQGNGTINLPNTLLYIKLWGSIFVVVHCKCFTAKG